MLVGVEGMLVPFWGHRPLLSSAMYANCAGADWLQSILNWLPCATAAQHLDGMLNRSKFHKIRKFAALPQSCTPLVLPKPIPGRTYNLLQSYNPFPRRQLLATLHSNNSSTADGTM